MNYKGEPLGIIWKYYLHASIILLQIKSFFDKFSTLGSLWALFVTYSSPHE